MKSAIAAAFSILATAGSVSAACTEGVATIIGDFGQARFSVEIADDVQERAQGLMFVEQMPTLAGMLFIYDKPGPASFWMRNTLIPLDMLFLDETGIITRLHENAIPGDETAIPGGDAVLAVLEINGGMAERLGIAEGDAIQHPSFGDIAAIPCAN